MTATPLEKQTSAVDVVRVLRNSTRWILLAGVIGTATGLLASVVVPPRWSAKMTIQIGQVTMPSTKGNTIKVPLESQLTAVERFNQPSFRLEVVKALGLPLPDTGNKTADLVFESMKASAERSPDLITVQVSNYSQEGVLTVLDTAFKGFSEEHRKLFEQSMAATQRELARSMSSLATVETECGNAIATLKSSSTRSAAGVTSSTHDILVSNTASLLQAQVSELRQQVNAYRDALAPLQTYPTRIIGPAYVPRRPSTPGWALWTFGGAVFGLLVGAALALVRGSPREA